MAPNAGRGRSAGKGRSGGRGCGDGDMILSTTQQTSTHTSSLGEVSNDVVVENGGEDSSSEKLELDPNSLWFEHNKVTREITNCIQAYYEEPWRNWSEVDKDTKDQWFRIFRLKFTWRSELADEVRRAFDQKGAKRLKRLHYWLTSSKPRKKGGVCPAWMQVNVHKQVMERLEDPEFKKRSEQAKKNKLSGVENGVIHPGHIQGSISTHEVAERLAKQKGLLPLAADVYLTTHSKTYVNLGKVPCSAKPKKIMDDYEKKKVAEYKEKGINKDLNEVYLEVVGGRKKGLVPGLGCSGDLWFKKSTSRKNSSSTTAYTPSLLSQLSSQLQQSQQQLEQSQQ
ncbi:hypothetical protein BVRB_8g183920 [Beta vulgaris subsp. vulgaris]|uniref:uncharacterized protein LOC104900764 n=1 Tax=Beta vulgaris subsp. vulgaris TaxID=3555 RepID=UPI00053F8E81|nr:uncharacterized protein LOC104900764 [Beta vulgaris subsp. vulgaris]KMT04317.1 hypothetical protein BVRB_8g183920 [Beta vulgaris subsp. vulgaris]